MALTAVSEIVYGLKLNDEEGITLAEKINFDLYLSVDEGTQDEDDDGDQSVFHPDDSVKFCNISPFDVNIILVSRKAPSYRADTDNDMIKLIPSNALTVDESFKNDIIHYCEKHQVPYNPDEIGWHLISYVF